MDKSAIQKLIDGFKQTIARKEAKISELVMKLKHAVKEDAVIFKMPEIVMPEKFDVGNLPEIQKVHIVNPKDVQKVHIENSPDIQKVELMNPPSVQEVQKVEVMNAEKSSGWVPDVIKHAIKALSDGWAKRLDRGIEVYHSDEDKVRPQAVVLVDTNGRPVNFNGNSQQVIIPMGGGGGRSRDASPPSGIGSGRKAVTTAGTRVQILSTSIVTKKVIITALASNSTEIYVGGSSVSGVNGSESGALLEPTGSATFEIDNINKVWIDAVTSGDAVSFTYLT